MLYEYRGRLTAVWSKGQKLLLSNEGFGKAREKEGVGPFTDKIHSSAGKKKKDKMTRL